MVETRVSLPENSKPLQASVIWVFREGRLTGGLDFASIIYLGCTLDAFTSLTFVWKAMYSSRSIEKFIVEASRQFPVLVLTGARQVGKTTLLKKLASRERTFVTLDDPLALSLAREDPALFMKRFSPPILIDEIQYAPGLLPYVKMAVDESPQAGLFWLTGSQPFHLMKEINETLAGRVALVQLLGLSRVETSGHGDTSRPFLPGKQVRHIQDNRHVSLQEIYEIIWRGSYPAVALNKNVDRNLFYSSYVQTYLQRDVRDLAKVGNETSFLRFLKAAAARTGQLLNIADLARDADVSPNTAKSWLSILQSSGIVYLLQPYHTNVTKRLVKAPKLYFLDTGICTWILEWTSPETLEAGAMSGAILETWIFGELLKSYWHAGQREPFYFYRDKDKKEIDLLIIQDGTIYPIEIKKTASPKKKDIRHFSLLEKLGLEIGTGGLICLTDHSLPLSERVISIPATSLCSL